MSRLQLPETTPQNFVDLNFGEIKFTSCDRDDLRPPEEASAQPSRSEPPPGFDRVSDLLDRAEKNRKTEFYDGTMATWEDIQARRDAARDAYDDAIEILEEADRDLGGRIPLIAITGKAGDGKTTLLMRLAADLARRGREVWYADDGGSGIPTDIELPPSQKRVVLCLDELGLCDRPQLEQQLKHLHTHGVPVAIVGTARPEQWRNIRGGVSGFAQPEEIKLGNLSDGEIDALLDRLSCAGALGKLGEKSVEDRRRAFRDKRQANQGKRI